MFNEVKRGLYQVVKTIKANSPTILSVVACGGVVATGVLSAVYHKKAIEKLKEEENKTRFDLTPIEKAKVLAPNYIWPAVSGGATIALILTSNALNKKQQAALYGGLIALDRCYKTYRNKVNDIYGESADATVVKEMSKDAIKKKDIPQKSTIEQTLFYEENSDQFFWSTMEDVIQAEYELNRLFILRGDASLNDWLKILDIPTCEFGDTLGWDDYVGEVTYGFRWIDFEHRYVDETEFHEDPALQCDDEEMLDVPGYWIIHTPFPPYVAGAL